MPNTAHWGKKVLHKCYNRLKKKQNPPPPPHTHKKKQGTLKQNKKTPSKLTKQVSMETEKTKNIHTKPNQDKTKQLKLVTL